MAVRLLDVSELRLTQGYFASARVGLVVTKQAVPANIDIN
jgi:hypothetical protein